MLMAGLAGLTRAGRDDAVDRLMERFDVRLGDGSFCFYAALIEGRRLCAEALRQRDRALWSRAAAVLQSGLDVSAGIPAAARGRAEYWLACARWQTDRPIEAAEHFLSAARQLRDVDDALAERALGNRCQVLREIADRDMAWRGEWHAALAQLIRWYPHGDAARRAAFDRTVAGLDRLDDAAALQALAQFGGSHPSRADAELESMRIRYRRWLGLRETDPAGAEAMAREIFASIETIGEANQAGEMAEEGDDGRGRAAAAQLKTVVLGLDVLLRATAPDMERARRWTEWADAWAARVDDAVPAASEYRIQRLRLAELRGAEDEAAATAEWLAEHGVSVGARRAGLMWLAAWLDRAAEEADDEPRRTMLRQQAGTQYEALAALYGRDVAVLRESANARLAWARTAQSLADKGQWNTAGDVWTRLLEAAPENRDYVRGAAQCRTRLQRWDLALPLWRRLAQGTEIGSDAWFEAKFGVAQCLAPNEPEQALRVLEQAAQLAADVPPLWQARFAELATSVRRQPEHVP
jgi:hypothetical protein